MEAIAVEWTEWFFDRLIFWESDAKKKAHVLRAVHHFLSYALVVCIIISHTLYPAFWFQTLLLGISVLVWIQHVLTRGCVVSKVEQKWLEDDSSFIDPYLEILHIEIDSASKPGVLILGSTIAVFILYLEWVGRVIHMMLKFLPTSLAIPHTLLQTSFPSI